MSTPTLRTFRIYLKVGATTRTLDLIARNVRAARSVASGSEYWTGEITEVSANVIRLESGKRHAA